MAENQLPNTDPDLILAQELQEYVQTGAQPQHKDPLFDALSNYKQERTGSIELDTSRSANIWKSIKSDIVKKEKGAKTNIFTLNTPKIAWAAAASVLIIALASIFYFMGDPQPMLLASTNQQIETTTLTDGSKVTLRPHSKLYEIAIREEVHIYKIEGEGFFNVTKNTNRTFKVEASNGIVTVLGTAFNLSSWGDFTQVFLKEGSIAFSSAQDNQSVILEPGQSASINSQTVLQIAESVPADEFTDWMNNEIIFTNQSARYIFQELEQQYDITITAPDSILSISLSGGIRLDNQKQSLNDLSKVLGGSFKQSQPGKFVFTSNN